MMKTILCLQYVNFLSTEANKIIFLFGMEILNNKIYFFFEIFKRIIRFPTKNSGIVWASVQLSRKSTDLRTTIPYEPTRTVSSH